jgi:hypothetical protein
MGLLGKLCTDLRGAVLTAEPGYPTQAVTIVSSLYETAFTVAYIGADERLAQEWADQAQGDPTRSFRSPWTLTYEGLKSLAAKDLEKAVEGHYQTYSQLCMAKHAHPGFLIHHSWERTDQMIIVNNGSNTNDAAIRAIAYALEAAVGLVVIAAVSFIRNHVPESKREALEHRAVELGKSRAELRAESALRWPGGDPYPGTWRRARAELKDEQRG